MILKIKRYNSTSKHNWTLIDNIRKVSHGIEQRAQNQITAARDICVEDWAKLAKEKSPAVLDKWDIAVAVCQMMDGEQQTIEFDTEAYVLNMIIAQMVSFKRVQQSIKTLIGRLICEATILKYILQLHYCLERIVCVVGIYSNAL